MSESTYPGLTALSSPELPIWYRAGVAKQLVSNHSEVFPSVRTEEQTELARLLMPLFRLSDVRWIVIGCPDCSTVMVLTCQPPASACTVRGLFDSHSRPRPKGSW